MKARYLTLALSWLLTLATGCSDTTETSTPAVSPNVAPAIAAPASAANTSTATAGQVDLAASLRKAAEKVVTATRKDCIDALVADWGQPVNGSLEEAYGDSCSELPLDACVNEMARCYRAEKGDREAFVSAEQSAEWETGCADALQFAERDVAPPAPETLNAEERYLTKLKQAIERQDEIQYTTPLVRVYEPYDPSIGPPKDLMKVDLSAVVEEQVSAGACKSALERDQTIATVAGSIWTLGALNADSAMESTIVRNQEDTIRRSMAAMADNCSDSEYQDINALLKRIGKVIAEAQQQVRQRNVAAAKEQEARAQQEAAALAARAQLIRSGAAKPESFREAAVALDAQHRADIAVRPMVQPDGRGVIMSGTLERIEGELFICKIGQGYFAIRIDLQSDMGQRAMTTLSYGGPVNAVGRYIDNATYTTVVGIERKMPVIQALWIE